MSKVPLRGVYAAALTPLNDDLSPDLKSLVRHYKWLLANGCDGLAPLGTTGEANSFSVDERLSVIDALGGSGIPMDRCIVGTGSCALTDSVRLTKRVLDAGGRDVLVLPPFYYKKVTDDGLFASFSEVIQRVGDSRLRLYIYQFPQMTGLDLSLDLIGRLIDAFPKTVVGVKDSSGNWPNMEAMCKRFPGFEVFPGSERFLVAWRSCDRRRANNLGQRRAIRADNGQATCHGLERWKAKTLKQRREEEAVGGGVGAR